ncbi:MAG: hypothetical protein Q9217_003310 [Psora testacea]
MGIHLFGHVVWDVTRDQLTQNLSNHIDPPIEEANFSSSILKVGPAILRRYAELFSPTSRRIHRHHNNTRALLVPEILRRRQLVSHRPHWKDRKPNDMLQWLEDASEGDDAKPERMVDRQQGMSFAAIHTATNHLTNIIYGLAARWDQYGPELRAEIEADLATSGGVWKKTTLIKLSKMYSSQMLVSQILK